MNKGLNNLWATPMMYDSMNNEQLRNEVCNYLFQNENSFSASEEFGETDILNDGSEVLDRFKNQIVLPAFDNYLQQTIGKSISDWGDHRLKGWLTRVNKDYSLAYHNHSGAQVSAVFYLMAEELQSGGTIVFTDPRQNANRGYDDKFSQMFKHAVIQPKSGDFVVFPSFLYHYVTTYQSCLRIAMPIDLFLFKE